MLKITLKAARVNKGLTQNEVAKKINIRRETLINWENGRSFPSPEQIDLLCSLYDVKYDNLYFFKA